MMATSQQGGNPYSKLVPFHIVIFTYRLFYILYLFLFYAMLNTIFLMADTKQRQPKAALGLH